MQRVCRLYSGTENGCTGIDDCSPGDNAEHHADDRCSNNYCTDNNYYNCCDSHHNHTAGSNQTVHNQTGDDPGNDNNAAGLRRTRFRHTDDGFCFARRHIGQRHLVADERNGIDDCEDSGNDDHAQRDHDQADYDRQSEGRPVRCV